MSATDIDFGASLRDGHRIGAIAGQLIVSLIVFLLKPLAVLTQVFFRKEMGERYFSPSTILAAVVLMSITGTATKLIPPPVPTIWIYLRLSEAKQVTSWYFKGAEYWVLVVWSFALAAAAWEHRIRIWRRERKGVKWHSRCSGIPRFRLFGRFFQYVLLAVAVPVFDAMSLSWVALLVLLSLASTIAIDYAEKRRLHLAVLDSIDAELDSESISLEIKRKHKLWDTSNIARTIV